MDENILVKLFGYCATILHGDSAVFDRWLWLRKNLKKGSLRTLDAGCGSGAFALYAAKQGNDAVGISFDDRNNVVATERARILKLPNAKFFTFNLNDIALHANELGKFDQIICFETIEHILADQKLASNLSALLNPGGRLLLTAPYKFYNARLLGDEDVPLSITEDGGHVRRGYTHEEMEVIFKNAGLVVENREYVSGVISQFIIALSRVLGRVVHHRIAWALTLPFRVLVLFDKPVTALVRYPYLSIAMIGIKK